MADAKLQLYPEQLLAIMRTFGDDAFKLDVGATNANKGNDTWYTPFLVRNQYEVDKHKYVPFEIKFFNLKTTSNLQAWNNKDKRTNNNTKMQLQFTKSSTCDGFRMVKQDGKDVKVNTKEPIGEALIGMFDIFDRLAEKHKTEIAGITDARKANKDMNKPYQSEFNDKKNKQAVAIDPIIRIDIEFVKNKDAKTNEPNDPCEIPIYDGFKAMKPGQKHALVPGEKPYEKEPPFERARVDGKAVNYGNVHTLFPYGSLISGALQTKSLVVSIQGRSLQKKFTTLIVKKGSGAQINPDIGDADEYNMISGSNPEPAPGDQGLVNNTQVTNLANMLSNATVADPNAAKAEF